MNHIYTRPWPPIDDTKALLMGVRTIEDAKVIHDVNARITAAFDILTEVLPVVSRVDGSNSRQLDRALRRYVALRSRDLGDEALPPMILLNRE